MDKLAKWIYNSIIAYIMARVIISKSTVYWWPTTYVVQTIKHKFLFEIKRFIIYLNGLAVKTKPPVQRIDDVIDLR